MGNINNNQDITSSPPSNTKNNNSTLPLLIHCLTNQGIHHDEISPLMETLLPYLEILNHSNNESFESFQNWINKNTKTNSTLLKRKLTMPVVWNALNEYHNNISSQKQTPFHKKTTHLRFTNMSENCSPICKIQSEYPFTTMNMYTIPMAFNKPGTILFVPGRRKISAFSTLDSQLLYSLGIMESDITDLALHSSDSLLAVGLDTGVLMCAVSSTRTTVTIERRDNCLPTTVFSDCYALCFSPNGDLFAANNCDDLVLFRVIDSNHGWPILTTIPLTQFGYLLYFVPLATLPNKYATKQLLLSPQSTQICMIDVENECNVVCTFEGCSDLVNDIACFTHGIVAASSGHIILWDWYGIKINEVIDAHVDGEDQKRWRMEQNDPVDACDIHCLATCENTILLSCGVDGFVRLWNPLDLSLLGKMTNSLLNNNPHRRYNCVNTLLYHGENGLLAMNTENDGEITLWRDGN
jgi:hypothetical protein